MYNPYWSSNTPPPWQCIKVDAWTKTQKKLVDKDVVFLTISLAVQGDWVETLTETHPYLFYLKVLFQCLGYSLPEGTVNSFVRNVTETKPSRSVLMGNMQRRGAPQWPTNNLPLRSTTGKLFVLLLQQTLVRAAADLIFDRNEVQCVQWIVLLFKRIVHPKMKICPRAVQDADQFVCSSEQIWKNSALYHLLTNGSSAVNGCCQYERKTLQQYTSNPHNSSPTINVLYL